MSSETCSRTECSDILAPAYLGFWHISQSLQDLEPELGNARSLNRENYWQHLLESLKVLLGLKNVVRLLLVSTFGQVTLNILTPVATLLLLKRPFGICQVGQSIAVLIVLSSAGLILGNILSGSLLKKLSTEACFMHSSQVCEGPLFFCPFFWQKFLLYTDSKALLACYSRSAESKVAKSVFQPNTRRVHGAIQSAINLFSMAVPSVLSMLLIALASSLGVIYILPPACVNAGTVFLLDYSNGELEGGFG